MIINWLGLIIGMAAVLGGAVMEGLHMESLMQFTAGVIVMGGTLGATVLACTGEEMVNCLKLTITALTSMGGHNSHKVVTEIVELATIARREGVLALEKKVGEIKDPFFSNNLRHIVDGYDAAVIQEMMETRISKEETKAGATGKVWETAGGFSPTVGIIGAVLGLIHVMGNLSDSSKLGSGIAVAFVATVYGVASANLVFIPLGNKLKKLGMHSAHEMELIMVGLLGIQAGLNPRVIEDKLNNMLGQYTSHDDAGGQKKAA